MFDADINRLLAMEDMWKVRGRVRPVPLDYGSIMDGTFVAPPLRSGASQVNGSSSRENGHQPSNGHANGDASGSTTPLPTGHANGNHRILKDQKELSPKETLELFMDR